MRVRTIRDHFNGYGDSYFKSGSAGPVYEMGDREAKRLIAAGLVEDADATHGEAGGDEGTGGSSGAVAESDVEERRPESGKGSPRARRKKGSVAGQG